jgi:hypothetical protein
MYFYLPDDGFPLMPKHVASNKNYINSIVVDGLYDICNLLGGTVGELV